MARKRNHGIRGGSTWRVAELATAQGGVVSLGQLRGNGVSARAAAARARRGELHRIHRSVYTVGHRSLGRAAVLRAAVFACGDGAVISHGTAAAFWGLADRWPVLIDVTVPVEAGRKLDGIRCRRCRYPDPAEIAVRRGVACTTPARTLVDEAGRLGKDSLRKLIGRAAMLKLLDLDQAYAAIGRAKGRRGLKLLRAILADWEEPDGSVPDVRSVFEALVLPRLLRIGALRPSCNAPLVVDGRSLRIDFLWAEQRLAVETDGRETHATALAFQEDRLRDQQLVASGYRVLRVTWRQIETEADAVVGRISRALGLPGQPDLSPRR